MKVDELIKYLQTYSGYKDVAPCLFFEDEILKVNKTLSVDQIKKVMEKLSSITCGDHTIRRKLIEKAIKEAL